MPSEIRFVASDFHTAVKAADKLFIVAPSAAIKDGTAFAALRASKDPLAVSCCRARADTAQSLLRKLSLDLC